jgi:DNA polymerase III epsilon subunit-like protein
MLESDRWVIIDTETTGIRNPVYPVEISAQVMRGWARHGEPLTVLLNFDVPIEPAAQKMHGYSREYLQQHGFPPSIALKMLLEYADMLPVVSYNLSYDWFRVLVPAFEYTQMQSDMRPGFCALNLTRYVVPTLPDFKLKTVIKTFGLAKKQVHHAAHDVRAVETFLTQYIGPHLTHSGIVSFREVAACANGEISVPPLYLSEKRKSPMKAKKGLTYDDVFAIGELVGICRTITLDKQFSASELNFLAHWLEHCPNSTVAPISSMFEIVRGIVADGHVTAEEQRRLGEAIDELLTWSPPSA